VKRYRTGTPNEMRTLEECGIGDKADQALNWSKYRVDLTFLTCGETQIFSFISLQSHFVAMTIKQFLL
jgi:hypothetical protein